MHGHHAAACNIGGGITAIHDAIANILHEAGRAAYFRSLREQVIPALATPKRKEPRPDIELWGHHSAPDVLLDVTVCAPWAQRYAADPNNAPTAAEIRKNGSYSAVGGISVTGVAVDLFGQFGPQLRALLEDWAVLARTRDLSCGVVPRRMLHTWRVKLSAAIAEGLSHQITAAQRRPAPPTLADPLIAPPGQPASQAAAGARPAPALMPPQPMRQSSGAPRWTTTCPSACFVAAPPPIAGSSASALP